LRRHRAAGRRRRHRRDRSRRPGIRGRTQPGAAVPPRGDAGDHGRVGPGLPPRARRRGSGPRRAPRGDEPARGRGQANLVAAAGALPGQGGRPDLSGHNVKGTVRSDETAVFPRFLDLVYRSVGRGEGVWLTTTDGRRILDASSGGAMVTCLGHAVPELVAAAAEQAERITYFYNHHFTSEPQERLADRVLEVVAPEMARVRFVSGGSEAN